MDVGAEHAPEHLRHGFEQGIDVDRTGCNQLVTREGQQAGGERGALMHRAAALGGGQCFACAPKGAFTLWVEVPPGQWSVGPVAGRRLGWVTGWV